LFDYRLSYLAPDIVKAEQGICGVLQGNRTGWTARAAKFQKVPNDALSLLPKEI
jgi:hypothetical protein